MKRKIKKLLSSNSYDDVLIALNLLENLPFWKVKWYLGKWLSVGDIIGVSIKSKCLGPLFIHKFKGDRYYYCVLFQFPKEGNVQLWISKYPVVGEYQEL